MIETLDNLLSDYVIEKLKSVDTYIACGKYSIMITCESPEVLNNVLNLVGRKCVLLHSFRYMIIPSVTGSNDVTYIKKKITEGINCIFCIKANFEKDEYVDTFSDIGKYVLVDIDKTGSTANVSVKGK